MLRVESRKSKAENRKLRRCAIRALVSVSVLGVWCPALPVRGAEPRAAEFVPDDALTAITIRDGDQLVSRLRGFLEARQFEQSKAFAAAANEPGFMQLRVGVQGLAAAAGTDVWSGIAALAGREMVLALAPGQDGQPGFIAVSMARDDALVERILTTVHTFTGLTKDGEPDPARSEMIDRVRVFAAKPDSFHCRTAGATILCNQRALLTRALAAHSAGKNRLIDAAAYRAASEIAPSAATIWAFADVPSIRRLSELRKPVEFALPNPLGGFLFGAWWHQLLEAESAVAWLIPQLDKLTLEARVKTGRPLDERYRGFIFDSIGQSSAAVADVPRQIASVCVERRWRDLWSEREKLLTLPAAGDLVNFANVMTTLMGKLDFVDEILPAVDGPTRLILARQNLSDATAARPTPELPAFALVTHLKEAKKLARRLETASQMAISFLNYDAGQKNQPTFMLGIENYKGCNVIKAEYPEDEGMAPPRMDAQPTQTDDAPDEREEAASKPAAGPRRLDIRYNFAPTAAVVGDYYVIATSLDLMHDLVDRLGTAATGAASGPLDSAAGTAAIPQQAPLDRLVIDLGQTFEILRANRDALVSNRVLEQDVSRAAAERFIDGFLDAFNLGDAFSIAARCGEADASATVELRFRPTERR